MLKDKKAKVTKKKEQMGKIKKSVKAGLVETPEPKQTEVIESPVKQKINKKSRNKKEVAKDVPVAVELAEAGTDQEQDSKTEVVESEEGVGHTLFVCNVPVESTRDQLVKLFTPYGKVLSILFAAPNGIIFTKTVRTPGVKAYIVLDSIEGVEKALKLDRTDFNGQQIFVKKCDETRKLDFKKNKCTVFVTNLDTKTDEASISEFFSKCGKIKSVSFVKNSTDKGKAFVCFESPDAANLALKLTDNMLDERQIKVIRFSPEFKKKNSHNFKPLKNLNKKEKNINQKGQKFVNKQPGNAIAEKKESKKGNNSEFRGVKSTAIKKKAPKKKPNKIVAKTESKEEL